MNGLLHGQVIWVFIDFVYVFTKLYVEACLFDWYRYNYCTHEGDKLFIIGHIVVLKKIHTVIYLIKREAFLLSCQNFYSWWKDKKAFRSPINERDQDRKHSRVNFFELETNLISCVSWYLSFFALFFYFDYSRTQSLVHVYQRDRCAVVYKDALWRKY
jgi:hypothetical protein